MSKTRWMRASIAAAALHASALCASVAAQPVRTQHETGAIAEKLHAIASAQVARRQLNSMLVTVLIDGRQVASLAVGEAMAGVPATMEGHFRNGAVAITYVAAVALRLAEEGIVDLDAPIARWLPDLPGGDAATIRMLANMTAGYPDHVANVEKFVKPFLADPFRAWTPKDLIALSLSAPRSFAPGQNWDYSHSDYVILGQALEAATGKPLHRLMQEYVLTPLKLDGTTGFDNATIPEPVIHSFTAERGVWEDSTFWNPSWTLPSGAIQVTTIGDMARSFDAIVNRDGFLKAASRRQMIEPRLVGFGAPLEGCRTCRTLTPAFNYGLGTVLRGDWVFQTPLFGGYASSVGALPAERAKRGAITIAVAVTYKQQSVDDWSGRLPNYANETVLLMANEIAPEAPIPAP